MPTPGNWHPSSSEEEDEEEDGSDGEGEEEDEVRMSSAVGLAAFRHAFSAPSMPLSAPQPPLSLLSLASALAFSFCLVSNSSQMLRA